MKKLWKVLAATAAVASVVPVFSEKDEKGGTLEALLWKAKWTRDPDYESKPEVSISIGPNNPFKKLRTAKKEDQLFADELMVDYCCDNSLAHDCAPEENNESGEEPCAEEESCVEEEHAECETAAPVPTSTSTPSPVPTPAPAPVSAPDVSPAPDSERAE